MDSLSTQPQALKQGMKMLSALVSSREALLLVMETQWSGEREETSGKHENRLGGTQQQEWRNCNCSIRETQQDDSTMTWTKGWTLKNKQTKKNIRNREGADRLEKKTLKREGANERDAVQVWRENQAGKQEGEQDTGGIKDKIKHKTLPGTC